MKGRPPELESLEGTPRQIALAVVQIGFLMIVLREYSKSFPRDGEATVHDFASVADSLGHSTVKVLSKRADGSTDLLPLATGFIVNTRRHDGRGVALVVKRLTQVEHARRIAVCYHPYVREANAHGPANLADAVIVGRDKARDLALLEVHVTDYRFPGPSVTLCAVDYCVGSRVLCKGFVRARNWSGQSYGKPTTPVTEVTEVLNPQTAGSRGLPVATHVAVADSAPLDPDGILSGAPAIDTSGTTIGMWVDRALYSRFLLPDSEIEAFLDGCGIAWR